MPYCPNCGRYVSLGDDTCPECECSLDGKSDDGSGPDRDSGPGATGRRGSRREGRPSRRERQESRHREASQRAGARSERNADRQTGKSRRTALAWAGGALGLTFLGTWALELFGGGGPKETIEEWRRTWTSGDDEAYREFLHSESPRRNDEQSRLATANRSLGYIDETREILDRTDTEASVRDVYLLTSAEFDDPRRITDVIDLRTEDGDWRIWDYRTEDTEVATNCSRSVTVTGLRSLECE